MRVPPSTDADLWLGYDDYYRLIERLSLQIHESGWTFDQILCLARGGMRVGDVVSRIFDLPLAILATSSYRRGQRHHARANSTSRSTSRSVAAHSAARCCWSTTWSTRA